MLCKRRSKQVKLNLYSLNCIFATISTKVLLNSQGMWLRPCEVSSLHNPHNQILKHSQKNAGSIIAPFFYFSTAVSVSNLAQSSVWLI